LKDSDICGCRTQGSCSETTSGNSWRVGKSAIGLVVTTQALLVLSSSYEPMVGWLSMCWKNAYSQSEEEAIAIQEAF